MRTQLDSDLSKMTLSPLQKAQYTVVKSLLDDGVTGGIAPGLLPYGGRASTAAANTSYMTIASYQLVSIFILSTPSINTNNRL
jgi:hypothetical protein